MNKLLRQLLSGGSLAAIQLCAVANAARGTTISGAHGNVVIAAATDFILVSNTADITGSLTNQATVGPNSFGIEVANGGTITGSIINAGILNATETGILVDNNAMVGGIVNNGKILVSGTGDDAFGIDSSSGSPITNNGTLQVGDAHTYLHVNNSNDNSAKAHGISQFLNGVSPTLTLTNTGVVMLNANGKATSTSNRDVRLTVAAKSALLQQASGTGLANIVTENVSNSGALTLAAVGTATNLASRVHVYVSNRAVIAQHADDAGDIELSLNNSATLKLSATALAHAGYQDTAYGVVDGVLAQYGEGDGGTSKLNETLTNSGNLSIAVLGKGDVSVADHRALATGQINSVLFQSGYDAGKVTQAITNSGNLSLVALASATGLHASAKAAANAEASRIFEQAMHAASSGAGVKSTTQSITNSGTLSLKLAAVAVGQASPGSNTNGAYARASADDIFFQSANENNITQSISNSGAVTLLETATATTTGKRDQANAGIQGLAYQFAQNGGTISQSFLDSAALKATLTATAKGALNNAYATAAIRSLIHQSATSNSGPVSQAATITSTGSLVVNVTALAFGTGNNQAVADNGGNGAPTFDQIAENTGGTINQAITFNGPVQINYVAAVTAGANALAQAFQSRPLVEQFTSSSNGKSTTQSITNTASLGLSLSAAAKAAGHATASAQVESKLMWQAAEDGGKPTSQAITNSGTISIVAKGVATGTYVAAQAQDEIGVEKQFAQARNSGSLTQALTNSGVVSVVLTAVANGSLRAVAYARLNDTMFEQSAEDYLSTAQQFTNSGSITLTGSAIANKGAAATQDVTARFGFDGIIKQHVQSGAATTAAGVASLQSITNSGSLVIKGAATVLGGTRSDAAYAEGGSIFSQHGREGSAINQSLSNSGNVTVNLAANAKGKTVSSTVRAAASLDVVAFQEVSQSNDPGQSAILTMTNSGTVKITLAAAATGLGNVAADGDAEKIFGQEADENNTAALAITNSGSISVAANMVAKATGHARASVEGDFGFANQSADEETAATLSVTNSGSVNLKLAGTAIATNSAKADIEAFGVGQRAEGSDSAPAGSQTAALAITNSGSLILNVAAKGVAGNYIDVFARATGFIQGIEDEGATLGFTNSGTVSIAASATAVAAKPTVALTNTETPILSALAVGLKLNAEGGTGPRVTNSGTSQKHAPAAAKLAVSNSGSFTVAAVTVGAGVAHANAVAYAAGISAFATSQNYHKNIGSTNSGVRITAQTSRHAGSQLSGSISNSGTVSVNATATGGAATAHGIFLVTGTDAETITNAVGGVMTVAAAGATALAQGIALRNHSRSHKQDQHRTFGGSSNYLYHYHDKSTNGPAAAVTGNISNNGSLTVSATGTVSAKADGISVNAANVSGAILNAGTLTVSAAGPAAIANGIHVFASQTGNAFVRTSNRVAHVTGNAHSTTPFKTLLTTNVVSGQISNSGSIIVNATGSGAVANDILVSGTGAFTILNTGTLSAVVNGAYGNAINVSGAAGAAIALQGGAIAGNIVEASGGNAITASVGNTTLNGTINPSKAKLGSLTIASGGTLTLGLNTGLGAGVAYVGSFKQTGTLGLNIAGDPTQTGSIHAASATLSGAVVLNPNVGGAAIGLAGQTYKIVFSDAALSGTWSSVSASNPTFFTATGQYSANEADVVLTRSSLGAIAGLTGNEQSVGNALEKIYEAGGGTGPLGTLTNALFALTPAQYAAALQELSGETIGDLAATDAADLQSFTNTIIAHLGGDVGGAGGATAMNGLPDVHPAQLDTGPISAWGGVIASGATISSTASSPGYRTHESGLMAGVDVGALPNLTLGLALGFNNGVLRTTNDHGDYTVFQVSGYGRYVDPDNHYYVLGDVTYGGFRNRTQRTITIPGLAPATVSGKFDSSTVSLYGEAGYHFDGDMIPASLTPYAAVAYTNASSDPFVETGNFVAPLSVASSGSNGINSYLGLQYSQNWMSDTLSITPHIKVAWEHDFSSNGWTETAGFAPVASIASFSINGSALAQDAAFVNAGVTLDNGNNVQLKFDYTGRLSSDRTESAITGQIVFKF